MIKLCFSLCIYHYQYIAVPVQNTSVMQAHEGSFCCVQGEAAATGKRRKAWLETIAISGHDIQGVAEESREPSDQGAACRHSLKPVLTALWHNTHVDLVSFTCCIAL